MKLTDFTKELASLAAHILGEEVAVVPGRPGESWSWNWTERKITVESDDLLNCPADVCRAVLLHECAHAAITRIHAFMEPDELRLYHSIVNLLEDIRIENWLGQRLPGCADWLQQANTLFGRKIREKPWPEGYQIQYLRAVMEKVWLGNVSEGCEQIVLDALEETLPAIEEIKAAIPVQGEGTSMARAILFTQQSMTGTFTRKILPVWESLVAGDLARGRPRLTSAMVPQFVGIGVCGGPRSPNGRVAFRGTYALSYLERARALSSQIAYLVRELRPIFQANSRGRERRGCASGNRLDIKAIMQFEADPRQHDRIWIRRTLPDRFDPSFVLILDTSVSMVGSKFLGAFDATVLLAEVCLQIGIPFAVWSFSDSTREVVPMGLCNDAIRRQRIDGMRKRLGSSTKMGSALRGVRSSGTLAMHANPVTITISDGDADNLHEVRKEVAALTKDGVACVGIGIEKTAEHMKSLFPRHFIATEKEDVATGIAEIIRESLLKRGNP